jgi:predicted dithiol-disulfide oxidoreductase (DUF899 family)
MSTKATKSEHKIVSREEWIAARKKLLEAEKELTRRSDEVARKRQELPWVRIEKDYRFETDEGSASLADLFRGRAPLAKLQEYKKRMGWTFPWASSFGSDFNFDFNISFTPEQQRVGIEYNYEREEPMEPRGQAPKLSRSSPNGPTKFAAASGTDVDTYTHERPGVSAFVLEDGVVYHSYSAYSRGVDSLWGMYQWLDRAPKGRNEDGDLWWRRHDEYGSTAAEDCCA